MDKMGLSYRLMLVLGLISLAVMTACYNYKSSSLGSGYMLFVLDEGIGHFSLEYPPRYAVKNVEVSTSPEREFTNVIFFWSPPKEKEKDEGSTSIIISVAYADSNIPDVETSLNYSLSLAAKTHKDYVLLEKFEVAMDRSHGQGAVYSWTGLPDPAQAPPGAVPIPAITRQVTFEHDGLIWDISMTLDTSNAEIDKPYFDHIMQTFKVLN